MVRKKEMNPVLKEFLIYSGVTLFGSACVLGTLENKSPGFLRSVFGGTYDTIGNLFTSDNSPDFDTMVDLNNLGYVRPIMDSDKYKVWDFEKRRYEIVSHEKGVEIINNVKDLYNKADGEKSHKKCYFEVMGK